MPVTRPTTVRKRDGKMVDFDLGKMISATRGAWTEVHGTADDALITKVAKSAFNSLDGESTDVETIQDAVEVSLMRAKQFAVARAYIVYRHQRAEARASERSPDPTAVSSYIHASKYARYRDDLGRRELFSETVSRVEDMHARRFPQLAIEIRDAFDMVRERRVLPSMRSMQFGGAAIEACNNRMFNCAASLVDRPRVFAETMFLLMAGCGVGYSVQFQHVEKLPTLATIDRSRVVHHVVGDSIEGWADAVDALVQSYLTGEFVEFSYHLIRRAGAALKTSGGRAPGHLRLRDSLERVRAVLNLAQGRQLRPIECHRIMCHIADAVLSGGIRRSAMICLFSLDDGEMINCKSTASWWAQEPWLANSNNSVVLKRDEVREDQFRRVLKMTRRYGEPGFLFVNDWDDATNPCAEILLQPVWKCADGTEQTGWAFCNLTEINAAKLTSLDDFMEVAHAAALIGTLQASYTNMPYLGEVSEKIAARDALLGVGMTGIQDAPGIALDPDNQRRVAAEIVVWNVIYAKMIGIEPAARTTCVKPSGTTSLALGSVGSGIHPHHSERYIRRVTADELELPFQAFRAANPAMCVRKPDGKWVIEFPVQAPKGATLREDLSAVQFLEMVRSTQKNWVETGTTRGVGHHNVSNTINVRPEEWGPVGDFVWQNRFDLTGVSMLPHDGDTIYPFAPFESVQTADQERRWVELIASHTPVDWSTVRETSDNTSLMGEKACAGGSCEL